jgi:hypothetical protein
MSLPQVGEEARGINLLTTFAAFDSFGLGPWAADMLFWCLLVVVFSTGRAGAEHWASDPCESLSFGNLLGDVHELARFSPVLEHEILPAALIPVNSFAHTMWRVVTSLGINLVLLPRT